MSPETAPSITDQLCWLRSFSTDCRVDSVGPGRIVWDMVSEKEWGGVSEGQCAATVSGALQQARACGGRLDQTLLRGCSRFSLIQAALHLLLNVGQLYALLLELDLYRINGLDALLHPRQKLSLRSL